MKSSFEEVASAQASAGVSADLANKSVVKALAILSALGEFPGGASASDLAQATGTSRPTVFRMLLSLEMAGYVERADGRYQLGWELARLGKLAHLTRGIAARVQPVLDNYAQRLNETVNFALRGSGGSFDIIAEGLSRRLLTTENQFVGKHFPAHASSSGKLLLSEYSDDQVVAMLPESLETFTESTIQSRSELLDELARIRSRGYATLDNELEVGLYSISVPVRDSSGTMAGMVATYGPTERLKTPHLGETVELLSRAAAEISALTPAR